MMATEVEPTTPILTHAGALLEALAVAKVAGLPIPFTSRVTEHKVTVQVWNRGELAAWADYYQQPITTRPELDGTTLHIVELDRAGVRLEVCSTQGASS